MSVHRCVSTHPIDLADGRPVAPGDRVRNLDTSDEHNQRLVDEGALLEEPAKSKTSDSGGKS